MRLKPRKCIDGRILYQCNVCKNWLPKEGFYADKRNKIGIKSSCKSCHCKISYSSRDKNKAKERDSLRISQIKQRYKAQFIVTDLNNEIWRAIPNTNNMYFVSNYGRVKTLKWGKERVLKQCKTRKGYLYVSIYYTTGQKTPKVHRLVAQQFIPNPNGYLEVNHKDEIKTNNHVSNLEWCNRQYNIDYGTWKERRRRNKQPACLGV